jgi:hypothetical protein
MFGLKKLDDRLRSVERQMYATGQHLERLQSEWRETREQILIQMTEIRRILRPDENSVEK